MSRSHGCEGAAQRQDVGMPWSHGCEGAAQRQDVGMSRSHGCEGTARSISSSQIDDQQQTGLFGVLVQSSTSGHDRE